MSQYQVKLVLMMANLLKKPMQNPTAAIEINLDTKRLNTKIRNGILYSSILNFLYNSARLISIISISGINGPMAETTPLKVKRLL